MNDEILNNYPNFFSEGTPPCATSDPEAFFPQEEVDETGNLSGRSKYYNESGAKAICAECPYQIQCLQYAIDNHEIGIWGGTTERQRRDLRRKLRNKGVTIEQIMVTIKR